MPWGRHQGGGGVPCQVQWGGLVPWPGGYPAGGYPGQGGTLAGGVPCQGVPWWGVPCWGEGVPWPGGYPGRTTEEYSIHDGRYASCVHAGGLSCPRNLRANSFNHYADSNKPAIFSAFAFTFGVIGREENLGRQCYVSFQARSSGFIFMLESQRLVAAKRDVILEWIW